MKRMFIVNREVNSTRLYFSHELVSVMAEDENEAKEIAGNHGNPEDVTIIEDHELGYDPIDEEIMVLSAKRTGLE